MPTYRVVVEYDGTLFHGLQFQPEERTVAGELQRALGVLFAEPIGISAAGRTDAGVHASGQVISFASERVFPIGRLDKDSEGLILLTNDGDIVNDLLRAAHGHEKEYLVTVDRPITDEFLEAMAGGVHILDRVTAPCRVRRIGKNVFRIVLTQGLNRQIRRMCEVFGYTVSRLIRVRFVNIVLEGLSPGRWRNLTRAELAELLPERFAPRRHAAAGRIRH